jgi:cardiolipin-specific phospholipase
MWPFSSNSASSSSAIITNRLDALRTAESKLLEYAKSRFLNSADYQSCESNNIRFELFDTPIDIPSVIRRHDDAAASGRNSIAMVIPELSTHADLQKLTIHGVKVTNNDELLNDNKSLPKPPLVLLHGYANGSLYFYRNFTGLAKYFDTIYALDMLGWGLSSRPKFDLVSSSSPSSDDLLSSSSSSSSNVDSTTTTTTTTTTRNAESFFVESLESWRVQHNLSKMTLAGHSMGGYVATAYAERYPNRVHKLILLSPVGVPHPPSVEEQRTVMSNVPFYLRYMFKLVRYLFDSRGITPGDFLRSLPLYKSREFVDSYIHRRLPAITDVDERTVLGEYLYQNSMLPGSGEYCLSDILTSSAHARVPLVERIPHLVPAAAVGTSDGLEIHTIYGERDWMDYTGGFDAQRLCNSRRVEWETNGRTGLPPPKVFVHSIQDAGHLLMLDNNEAFNFAVIQAASGNTGNEGGFSSSSILQKSMRESGVSSSSSHLFLNDVSAASFFRGPRWNTKNEQEEEKGDS